MLIETLLVLTQIGEGDLRVTLSPAADAVECEANRDAVVTILTDAGRPPLVALCGQTGLRLTPFLHGIRPEDETHRYRVKLPESGGFVVMPLAEGEGCAPGTAAGSVIYCARSAQSVVKED
ncbi:hypothetical protein M3484_15890 [Pseudomonas sp. GX19020]|uniref:hypothetical protein n=1 Tax=Pseudomonas sp. GX19020 TaxID=2942277 RepID=UPI002019E8B2|nr:hypothetical protein [Pseudomonas sp. GX19020]MCL4068054.1 hypothetical protein [Pseudomonas sp. GX19020]